ncbi:MAG: acyloxyacyl hydrolase [Bacteroidetes bacterium]|nr:acyloxyacyl hydrolase [Bacteroidota bacterium]
MSHLVKDRNTAFELEFSQQDNRHNATADNYRFPSRGFSLQYQDYGYKEVLGSSYTVFQFTKFNLIQTKKFGFLDFRIGSGVAFITKEYEVVTNPKNNAIGSKWNAFVNFQLVYSKTWNNFLFGAGLEMSHYSNAAITMPNLGLNTPLCFVKAGYQLGQRKVYTTNTDVFIDILPRVVSRFQVNVIGSVKQNLPGYNLSKYLPVIATQVLYRKYLNYKWDFEAGVDVIYCEANRRKYDDKSFTMGETIQVGIYAGAAANFYKSQIFFGLAGYVYNKINPAGWVYNRIGYRYNFNDHWNALVAIKANIGIADYLEMGVGYRL